MTFGDTVKNTARRLHDAGIDFCETEARELCALASGTDRRDIAKLRFDEYPRACAAALDALIMRRIGGEPLQYIIGEWEFMGLTFKVDARALIPRQDTETLVEEAMRLIKARGYKTCLDMCTGTGAIGIALAKLTGIDAALADISPDALALARENAKRNAVAVRMICTDLFSDITESYDIIVSNPPYISEADMMELSREVRREPQLALYGGRDGLDFYRRIALEAPKHMRSGGALLLELGAGQAEAVRGMLKGARTVRDLNGIERVLIWEA